MQKTRHHVLWVDSLPHLSQLDPSPRVDFGLRMTTMSWPSKAVMLGPRKFISTSNWPSEIAILGPEWCGYGLELTFSDRHTWPPQIHLDLELAAEKQPYLVPDDATLAIKDRHAWSPQSYHDLELIVKRRPCLVVGNEAMTSSWLSSIAMLGLRKLPKKVMIRDLQGVHIISGANLFHWFVKALAVTDLFK